MLSSKEKQQPFFLFLFPFHIQPIHLDIASLLLRNKLDTSRQRVTIKAKTRCYNIKKVGLLQAEFFCNVN